MCKDALTEYNIMQRAHLLGMTNGDYVFFAYNVFPSAGPPWHIPPNATQAEIQKAIEPFLPYKKVHGSTIFLESVLIINLRAGRLEFV